MEFVESLKASAQTKIGRWLKRLEEHGPNLLRPMADVLSGPIRELRVSFGREDYRFLYFIHSRHIVVTRGLRKKTHKIEPLEIERAFNCRRDWLARSGVRP